MKRFLLLPIAAVLTLSVQARVRLPHLIGDNMVLQQQSEARLWGWAKPGSTVKVTTSWQGTATAKAGSDGKWLARVTTGQASNTPQTVTFDDGDGTVAIRNVLIGEVWVCAGQSNMEMPVRGFWGCPVEDYNQTVIDARNHGAVRSVKIPSVMRMEPQDDAQCEWRECGPQTVGDFSATGYFFARTMHQALGIPVGIIEANKGGSRVESWLTKDTVKGILFYQGCSNVGDPGNQYSERLKLLVAQWRQQFALGEIPFYFVEIAPYHYDDVNGTQGALLREQQQRAAQLIPNSSLVCTNDLVYPYETTQIHPAQKRQVGERLAWTALSRDYGFSEVLYKSSSYKDMTVKGDTVFIHLQDNYHADAPYEMIKGFEVAGQDRVFHPARARHFWRPGGGYWDEAIMVVSDEVKQPVAVRYCFRNFQLGNVTNGANLPLFPFRTDNW